MNISCTAPRYGYMSGVTLKKLPALGLLLMLTGISPLLAIELDGRAPEFSGLGSDAFNSALNTAFGDVLDKIKTQVKPIEANPQKLIGAFATSSVFSSAGATPRAYGDYKLFSVTLGPMIGLQLPSSPFGIMDELKDLTKKLQDEKDLQLGLNPQVIDLHIGLNTSWFLVQDLYLGIKIGYMKLDGIVEGLSFDSLTLGLTANYQWLSSRSLAAGLVLWRGINFGTGIIYQGTDLGYVAKISGNFSQPVTAGSSPTQVTANLEIDPKLSLDFNIHTVTIPLEAVTSVRLLWFLNLSLGLGVDIGFGSATLKGKAEGDINVKDLQLNGSTPSSSDLHQSEAGYLSTTIGGSNGPDIFNLKLISGLGISLGPVVLDIPITYYPLNDGFNLGVTLGVIW